MKKLSPRTGDEVWIKPDYAIARFMGSKVAFKTVGDSGMICTAKPIQERNREPQVQLHVRFIGTDVWKGVKDTVDIDVYIPLDEWDKLIEVKRCQ
ncbi:MAG: hypothetical protein JJE48_06725 [Actinobacteria bacterium]|nr:hypothetical protein [Actinomycetota bacterium]